MFQRLWIVTLLSHAEAEMNGALTLSMKKEKCAQARHLKMPSIKDALGSYPESKQRRRRTTVSTVIDEKNKNKRVTQDNK